MCLQLRNNLYSYDHRYRHSRPVPMASYEEGRPLPKFGEWDVNDPASAEGFTVIFSRARNEKVTGGPPSGSARSMRKHLDESGQPKSALRKWFCCGSSLKSRR